MENLTYREFNKSEFDDLLNFLETVESDFYPPLSKRTSLSKYLKSDLTENSKTVLALSSNKIIGFINLQLNEPNLKECYINTVCVDINFRKLGIATHLVKNIINYAKDNEFENIKTRTWSINKSGLALYKKFDFVVDYIVPNDRPNKVDSIYLVKKLD